MGYYPIFLNMADRRCAVIGGGAAAERKAAGLIEAGARVTVLSPALTPRLDDWARQGKIRHETRAYQAGDLAGFELAFVATDDGAVNQAVFLEGREKGVWVNAADDTGRCDFILPSVLRRGELVVAVATGGTSPALSRAIRAELEAHFTEDYSLLAEIVAEVRRELRARSSFPSAEEWQQALDGELRSLIKERKQNEARTYLLRRLVGEI